MSDDVAAVPQFSNTHVGRKLAARFERTVVPAPVDTGMSDPRIGADPAQAEPIDVAVKAEVNPDTDPNKKISLSEIIRERRERKRQAQRAFDSGESQQETPEATQEVAETEAETPVEEAPEEAEVEADTPAQWSVAERQAWIQKTQNTFEELGFTPESEAELQQAVNFHAQNGDFYTAGQMMMANYVKEVSRYQTEMARQQAEVAKAQAIIAQTWQETQARKQQFDQTLFSRHPYLGELENKAVLQQFLNHRFNDPSTGLSKVFTDVERPKKSVLEKQADQAATAWRKFIASQNPRQERALVDNRPRIATSRDVSANPAPAPEMDTSADKPHSLSAVIREKRDRRRAAQAAFNKQYLG